ncbi:hypothetical protein PT974_00290 [Cladobotryum mycophilum]|uniref:Uncharacterized protein n=1 Tax=Cladobotryum mycophilum TaxID=491253 RepID=A0ABR0T0N8_9HYPO
MTSWSRDEVLALAALLVTISLTPLAWLIKALYTNNRSRDSTEMRYELAA